MTVDLESIADTGTFPDEYASIVSMLSEAMVDSDGNRRSVVPARSVEEVIDFILDLHLAGIHLERSGR